MNKSIMCKLIMLILIIVTFSSCSNQNTDNESNGDVQLTVEPPKESIAVIESNDPVIFDDVSNSINIYYPVFYKLGNEKILSWNEYFEQKHGVDLNVEYMEQIEFDELLDDSLDGILYLNYYWGNEYNAQIATLINTSAGKLNDMSKYYELYGWNNYIDDRYTKIASIQDEIFAVPAIAKETIYPRYYNKEIIDSLGITIPDSIESFTEYLKAAKNYENCDYPLFISFDSTTRALSDVFRAYDVYVNSEEHSMITFNPKTNSFEDSVFSENFSTAFSYIRMLQSEGLLRLITPAESMDRDFAGSDVMIASEYYSIFDPKASFNRPFVLPDYEYYTGAYLTGSNTEKLIHLRKDIAYYLFPKSIKDIDSLAENFNDIVTNDTYCYDLLYGIEGENYSIDNDQVVFNNDQQGNTDYLIRQINKTPLQTDVNNFTPYSIDDYPESLLYETNTSIDLRTLGYSLLDDFSSYKEFGGYTFNSIVVEELFMSEATAEEAITQYKKEFMKYGMSKFIDAMNEKIGLQTKTKYSLDN